jgi:hypothetical protein
LIKLTEWRVTDLKNIFESGELVREATISILETIADDGKNYQVQY